jgi:hypothetical protein
VVERERKEQATEEEKLEKLDKGENKPCGFPSCQSSATAAKKKCKACGVMWYCSREHQKSHWKAHRVECGKAGKGAAGGATDAKEGDGAGDGYEWDTGGGGGKHSCPPLCWAILGGNFLAATVLMQHDNRRPWRQGDHVSYAPPNQISSLASVSSVSHRHAPRYGEAENREVPALMSDASWASIQAVTMGTLRTANPLTGKRAQGGDGGDAGKAGGEGGEGEGGEGGDPGEGRELPSQKAKKNTPPRCFAYAQATAQFMSAASAVAAQQQHQHAQTKKMVGMGVMGEEAMQMATDVMRRTAAAGAVVAAEGAAAAAAASGEGGGGVVKGGGKKKKNNKKNKKARKETQQQFKKELEAAEDILTDSVDQLNKVQRGG